MAFMGRTKAVALKMISDIERILHITTIIVHCIFFIFYGYSIYNNIDNKIFLSIYSLLFISTIINFITYFITYKKNSKNINSFKRLLRVFKYIINGTMLIINGVEMVKFSASDFNKILFIVSVVALITQIIMEFIRIFAKRYIDLFIISIQMDLQIIQKLKKIKEVKGNLFEIIDAPLEAIANKIEGKIQDEPKLSQEELYVNALAEEYNIETQKRKMNNKQQVKVKSKENANIQKKEIVEHLGVIKNKLFKRNK